jgi:hypothetical protein
MTANQTFSEPTIEGSFNLYGWEYDRFSVLFRSDGSIDNHWQSPWGGIGVRFTMSSNPDYGPTQSIQIRDFKFDYDESLAVLASSDFLIEANTDYDFKIVDDGYNISVYMNNSVAPVLAVGTSVDYGDTVQFSNRSQMHSGPPPYNMELDYITIVPEPSGLAVLGIGLLSLWSLRRR